jgi:hypothetical protein
MQEDGKRPTKEMEFSNVFVVRPELSKALRVLVVTLFAIGLVVRLLPLLNLEDRLLQMYPTEDGYLMLTIARNLAIGKGFSVADGTIPTNGTQPLVTLIWALGFFLCSGHKTAGVLLAQILQIGGSLVAAYLLYRLGVQVLEKRRTKRELSLLAAAAWYASTLVVPHSMNCLETGFYAVAVMAVALVFIEPESARDQLWSWKKCAWVGVLLGGAFWVRNDAVFLILAACLIHLFNGLEYGLDMVERRFRRALAFGSISILTATPWLAYNYLHFGHIMPVSGRAESLTGSFASNLFYLPPVLTEYATLVVPIPETLQLTTYAVAATSIFLLLLVPLISLLWARASITERTLMLFTGLFGAGLSIFYGFFFGAHWFVSRYMFPLSPLIAIAWAAVVLRVHHRIWKLSRPLAMAAPVLMVAVVVGLHFRAYDKGKDHMHFQVVRWVEENVAVETWVGAIQTGTLGYFHDRTINLDGKVNIHAYNALIGSRIADYVVDETQIVYLADWVGMLDWRTMPRIDESFEVVIADYERNLGVLKRKSTATSSTAQAR